MFFCVLSVIIKMEAMEKGGAEMERMKQITRGTGKVIMALSGGVLMPILLWVAFAAAINQVTREKRLQRKTAHTTGGILATS